MKRHIFWVLALVSSMAWANGSLKDVQGDVKIDAKPAAIGAEVVAGSTVKTGPASRVTIRFADGQIVVLGANTEFKVRQYVYSKEDPSKDNIVLDIFRGTLRAISGALGHRNPSKFALYTPTATAGIRGTDFAATVVDYVGQDGVTRQQATFAVKSGRIEVATKAGKLTLGKGKAVVTSPSGAITPVAFESLSPELQQLFNLEFSGAGAGTSTTLTGAGVGGATAVVVPAVAIAGAIAGLVSATADNSTVTGHHSTSGHTPSHHNK